MSEILHHQVRGSHLDVALLFIHPLGADLTFWDDVVTLLEGRIACVACDLRGAGASPKVADPVLLDAHVEDLEALCAFLKLASVVPVGCAVGSMVAARYAAAHPERTPALVLSNPALKTSAQAQAMLRERAELVRRLGMRAILPEAVDRAFLGAPRDERYHRYYNRFASQDPAAYALAVLAASQADVTNDLARILCPTLVVAGAHDVLLPPTLAQAVADTLTSAHSVMIEEAAHFAPYQRPDTFVEHATAFLQTCGLLVDRPSVEKREAGS
jgi:3-oxoadipate enol-lactonase